MSARPERLEIADAHTGLMTRSMALLFAVGASLILCSLALPGGLSTFRVLTSAGAGYAIAVVVWLAGPRLPRWTLQLFLAFGTVMIEWVVYGTQGRAATYTVFYFWIATYAFQFFTAGQAAGQLLFIFCSYAAVLGLVVDPTSPEALRWALTTFALVVSGAMVGALRHRNGHLLRELSASARTDPLTSLLNRRGFEERCVAELARARRHGERLTLAIGDLDGFKAVNDDFGHHEGDRALRLVARALAGELRGSDAVARIGGEEFALLLPDTDEHGAYLLVERIREGIATSCAHMPGALTISFGLATFPQHGHEADSLMRAADQALYMAKKLGRDRSVVFSAAIAMSVTSSVRADDDAARDQNLQTALRLAEVLDIRDAGTAAHSQLVARYAEAAARKLRLPDERVTRIRYAGLVHDIGKIGIDDAIICKPGPLAPIEEREMRRHPEIGARILSRSNLADIAAWVIAHHERPDGNGYPHRLAATQIPLEAKILAVADAYEAMTNDRVYRPAMSETEARRELRAEAGTQFDERVVLALLSALGDAPADDGPPPPAAPLPRRSADELVAAARLTAPLRDAPHFKRPA